MDRILASIGQASAYRLANAAVPGCLLDGGARFARQADDLAVLDIDVTDGRIAAIAPAGGWSRHSPTKYETVLKFLLGGPALVAARLLGSRILDLPWGTRIATLPVSGPADGPDRADLEALVNEAAVLAVRRSVAAAGKVPATIAAADLERLLAARAERVFAFDRLDMVLVESTSQMSEVTGRARAGFQLTDGTRIEGEVVWADAFFVKIQTAGVAEAGVEPSDGDGDGRQGMLIPKAQILSIQPLAGTEAVDRDELAPDQLAGKTPDLA